jgi:hypothetical protein
MTIYLDNDFESEFALTRKNAQTGASEAAAGLSGLTCRLSATDGGAAIHADVTINMSERASKAGTYYGVFDGDKLRTQLLSYVGSSVWEVFGDGTNVLISKEHHVLGTRPPDK